MNLECRPRIFDCLTLYAQENGKVVTDVESKSFAFDRGVKQGDPLSALLFISILEKVMRSFRGSGMTVHLVCVSVCYNEAEHTNKQD